MRVPLVLILGLAVGLASSRASAQGAFVWAKQLTSTASCSGVPESLAVDAVGNVYVAGHFCGTTDVDPGPGTHLLASASRNAYVLKLDSAGSFVWAAPFGGTLAAQAFDVAVDPAGNVFVTGTFQGTVDFDPGPGTSSATSAGSTDVFAVKLDTSGALVWARAFGAGGAQAGGGIAVDPNGNVYVVGDFTNTVDFDPGPGNVPLTATVIDAFIVKLDSAGSLIWARRVGGAGVDRARAVAVDGQNATFVGEFGGTADFDPGAGTFNLVASGTVDAFVCRLDSNGGLDWARQLGGSSTANPNDAAYDVALGAFGVVYTVGDFAGTADFDPGPSVLNLTAVDSAAFVSKLDNAGAFLFAKQLGGNTNQGPTARSVSFVNGRVYTVGNFRNTSDFDPGPGTFTLAPPGQPDAYISVLDGSGGFHWAGRLGGEFLDQAFAVAVSTSDNIYTVGTFGGPADFDPGSSEYLMDPFGIEDSFVSRISPQELGGTVPGLTVRKSGATDIRLDWGVSCTPGMPFYGVYEGDLGDFTSHFPRACSFGPVTTMTLTPFAGNKYYLVVPNDDFDEGSYGRNSAGVERPMGQGSCALQVQVLGCP